MKKTIKNLILLILLIPTIAQADMSAPVIEHLDAIVSNKEGAITKDGKKLEYGQKVSLRYSGGDMYFACLKEDSEKCYYISTEDLSPLEYNLEDFKEKENKKLYAYQNTKMYSGPAGYYKEIPDVEIPAGTVLSSKYYSQEYMYVTYKGVSGWVYTYPYKRYSSIEKSALASFWDSKDKVYTITEVALLDAPLDGQEIGKRIPKDSKLNVKYIYRHEPYAYYIYVEYQGNEGWILHDYLYDDKKVTIKREINKQIYIIADELNVYDDISQDAKIIGTVVKDQEVDWKYNIEQHHSDGYNYIKTNEIEGWLRPTTIAQKEYVLENRYRTLEEYNGDYKVYKSLNENSEVIGSVKLHGKYKVKYYHSMNYIENINGISGWISGKKASYIKLKNTSGVYEKKGELSNYITTIEKDTDIPYYDSYEDISGSMWYQIINYNGITGWVLDENIETKVPSIDPTEVKDKEELDKLYYILGGTIGLVIITGTTIVLINKKKKTKTKDQKTKKETTASDNKKVKEKNDN